MISIVICDDDAAFAQRLKAAVETILERGKTAARIHAFSSAEEIGQETLADCDVAFFDIDFAEKSYNGLDVARRLRALRDDAVIVFVTNYVEYAPEGYELRAFRYLLKDELAQKLPSCVEQALEALQRERSELKILIDGEQIALGVRDIVYLESMGHSLIYHVRCKGYEPDRTYSCYGAIGKMEEELAGNGFLRTQKSYLVNMAHIRKLSSQELLLSNGVCLPVSAKNYADCKRQYLLWRGKH